MDFLVSSHWPRANFCLAELSVWSCPEWRPSSKCFQAALTHLRDSIRSRHELPDVCGGAIQPSQCIL
jgi:hypothetical protein